VLGLGGSDHNIKLFVNVLHDPAIGTGTDVTLDFSASDLVKPNLATSSRRLKVTTRSQSPEQFHEILLGIRTKL
jgi:hypothetical protein